MTSLVQAVRDGVVPRPAVGEAITDYQLRAAHAGALVTLAWLTARQDTPVTSPGQHGDVTTFDIGDPVGSDV